METTTDERIALMGGAAALPRKNGELLFHAPWESRAFGMAVVMNDLCHYDWEEFRQRLIGEIAKGDSTATPANYYEQWLASFESVLLVKGLVAPDELEHRTHEYQSGERDDED